MTNAANCPRPVIQPQAGYPGTFLDVAAGFEALAVAAKEYPGKLDLSRIIVFGHSAGGHLALWLAAESSRRENGPLLADASLWAAHSAGATMPPPFGERIAVAAVVAQAPVADLVRAVAERLSDDGDAAKVFMGGTPEEAPERYAYGSPCPGLLPLGWCGKLRSLLVCTPRALLLS